MYHFNQVDKDHIISKFTNDKKHRLKLEIPFLNRGGEKTIFIIGQNPSKADNYYADPHYILLRKKYVYENLPLYSKIIMLNLYSRIDTNKNESHD